MGRHSAPGGERQPRHSTTHDEYAVSRAELLEALGIPAGHETAIITEPGGGLVIRVHRDTTPPVLYHPASEAAGREEVLARLEGRYQEPPPYLDQELPWPGHQAACRHCQRSIILSPGGVWLDTSGFTQCRKMTDAELTAGLRPLHEPDLGVPQCRGAGLDEDGS